MDIAMSCLFPIRVYCEISFCAVRSKRLTVEKGKSCEISESVSLLSIPWRRNL